MKNVTISLTTEADSYARVMAATKKRSLSGYISDLLIEMASREREYSEAFKRFKSRKLVFGAKFKKSTREELYDRKILR